MARWLSSSSQSGGQRKTATARTFELACRCGRTYRGRRHKQHQEFVCRECGEHLFVLPVNPYPPPPRKRQRKRAARKDRGSTTQQPSAERPPPHIDESPSQKAPRPEAERLDGEDLMPVEPHSQPKRKRITLFRVALLLAAAVLSTTIWWTWRESRLESAERTLADAEKNGYEALREADFVTAEMELGQAVQALNVLGYDDRRARAIRQMHRETRAANELIGKPLFEIVEDVREVPAGEAGRRREYFRAHYADDWIIVDAPVQRAAGADGTARLTVEYPLAVGGHPVVLQTDAGAFGPLQLGAEPRRLIFAAQLHTCRLDSADKQRWVISLRPETAFLWTDADNYRALGFADADEASQRSTRALLERQARLQGVDG